MRSKPVFMLAAVLLATSAFACDGPAPGATASSRSSASAAPPAKPSAPSATPSATAATPSPTAASVHFYKGKVTTTSPDGKTPYGPPTDTVVSRTIDPGAGTIVEDVVSAGKEFPTTMRRNGTTSVFQATDAASSFTGTITFGGPEWQWDSWTYAITLANKAGSISGTGKIASGVVTTEKMFTGPDGKPSARITEELSPSTAEEFEREKTRLLALPKPSRH